MSWNEGQHLENIGWGEWIPIFPLSNVVLMPRLMLPLHVFEPRYRVMTSDALEGSRNIAVAMLRTGYESLYHTLEAPIHETVCVGKICREERLQDGRFNFLLQGLSRARIVEEDRELTYRRAKLEPLVPKALPCEVEIALRKSLMEILSDNALAGLAGQFSWLNSAESCTSSFSDVVDLLAATVLICPEEKQTFLELVCPAKRAQYLCAALHSIRCDWEARSTGCGRPRGWPPKLSDN